MTKAGSECCELPLKAPAEGKEEIQEVTASLAAAAKGISVDATVATGGAPTGRCCYLVHKAAKHLIGLLRMKVTDRGFVQSSSFFLVFGNG